MSSKKYSKDWNKLSSVFQYDVVFHGPRLSNIYIFINKCFYPGSEQHVQTTSASNARTTPCLNDDDFLSSNIYIYTVCKKINKQKQSDSQQKTHMKRAHLFVECLRWAHGLVGFPQIRNEWKLFDYRTNMGGIFKKTDLFSYQQRRNWIKILIDSLPSSLVFGRKRWYSYICGSG